MSGGKVSITEKVDPSLIGGYVLTVNDIQFDESVQTKLTKLREQLLDTSYIPKIDLI
jgi:F-type H+-transporting ATPase subunit delta